MKKVEPAKPNAPTQPTAPVTSVISQSGEPCPPDIVLQEALLEPCRRPLTEYADAIQVLRNEKKFTFREIADWLKNYNVETDHNAVYREYTKAMPDREAEWVAQEDDHIEEAEARRS